LLSRHIPAHRLRAVIAILAICAGLQLVVSGVKARFVKPVSTANNGIAATQSATRYSPSFR
jgi:gamma-glutamyl-gamma-aminobutyrate hydrolase PuuD